MELTNETYAPLRVFADELVRCGVRHAVAAPGSRNAPIIHALADQAGIRVWSILDERSAGFFALGVAKSTGEPVAVTCTSGTAAANLHPAVIEADHAGVPLVLLTADRPPELRDVGAGQAIDQIKLYGDSVRWFVEAGNHPLSEDTLRHFRALACRAVAESRGANPGPVHVNLPLREPLHPEPANIDLPETGPAVTGRADGEPWTEFSRVVDSGAPDLLADLATAARPLIVVGEQNTPGLADAIAGFAAATGVPVLADALSQMRRRSIAENVPLVCAYDLILRDSIQRERLAPDRVLRLGELPTSKVLRTWLAGLTCPQVAIDPRGVWHESTRVATRLVQCDPLATFNSFDSAGGLAELHAARSATPDPWTGAWRAAEAATQSAIDDALAVEPFPFEPDVYRSLLRELDAGATVWVSSSMPVRDVEAFVAPTRDDVRFLAGRGANGIDGVLSAALGAKAPWSCDRVILLTGDLALLYDVGALATAKRLEIPVTIVCVDNGGGGIFSFLPVSGHDRHFEELIATPHDFDLAGVCAAFGLEYTAPGDAAELSRAVGRAGLVHLRTDRAANRDAHRRVYQGVAAAVRVTPATESAAAPPA